MVRRAQTPLSVKVSRGVMTIEIGVETLAHAALLSPYVDELYAAAGDHEYKTEGRHKVTDPFFFAQDVAKALNDELGEDGSTILTQALDRAIEGAIEQGSEHFIDTREDQ